jgi:hypothetical protein
VEGLATGAAVVCPPWHGTSVWGPGGCWLWRKEVQVWTGESLPWVWSWFGI